MHTGSTETVHEYNHYVGGLRMKKTGKKLLAIATAVSLAALALSGCGGGSAAPSSAAQPSETKKEEAQKQEPAE